MLNHITLIELKNTTSYLNVKTLILTFSLITILIHDLILRADKKFYRVKITLEYFKLSFNPS